MLDADVRCDGRDLGENAAFERERVGSQLVRPGTVPQVDPDQPEDGEGPGGGHHHLRIDCGSRADECEPGDGREDGQPHEEPHRPVDLDAGRDRPHVGRVLGDLVGRGYGLVFPTLVGRGYGLVFPTLVGRGRGFA